MPETLDELTRLTAEVLAQYCDRFSLYRITTDQLLDLMDGTDVRRVLDVGCGVGASTEVVLRRWPQARVMAADVSRHMLVHARARLSQRVPAAMLRVHWHAGAAEQMPSWSPEPVDAIVCNAAIWQMDIEAVLSAARAVLAPAGSLLLNLVAQDANPSELDAFEQACRRAGVAVAAQVDAGLSMATGFAPDVAALAARAGFVRCVSTTVAVAESAASQRLLLRIPGLTKALLPELAYHARMAILDRLEPDLQLVERIGQWTHWRLVRAG